MGRPFSIEHDGLDRIAIRGELDMATAPRLAEVLGGVRGDVLVECQGLEFIDSTGLGGGHPEPTGVSPSEATGSSCEVSPATVRRIFEVAGLDQVSTSTPRVEPSTVTSASTHRAGSRTGLASDFIAPPLS